jgi:hypothetical protein
LKATSLDERDIAARQLDFQIEGMKARAKQYRNVPQGHSFLTQFKNLLADKLGLHLLTARLNELGAAADAPAGEKALLVALFGALDDLVGQI